MYACMYVYIYISLSLYIYICISESRGGGYAGGESAPPMAPEVTPCAYTIRGNNLSNTTFQIQVFFERGE